MQPAGGRLHSRKVCCDAGIQLAAVRCGKLAGIADQTEKQGTPERTGEKVRTDRFAG